MTFKIGDKVDCFGVKGIIENIHNTKTGYPISVKFSNGEFMLFTSEGKLFAKQTQSMLKHIVKVSKKRHKTVQSANVNPVKLYWGLWKYDVNTETYNLTVMKEDKADVLKLKKPMDKVARVAK